MSLRDFRKVSQGLGVRPLIPKEQVVVCGASIGYGKEGITTANSMPRVDVDELARFIGFDS